MTMSTQDDMPDGPRPADKAGHGYSNEVKWGTGKGRQPYSNQGAEEAPEPSWPVDETAEGDRGAHSGTNLEQMEQVKRKP